MKKAILAFGLVVMTAFSVTAQETAKVKMMVEDAVGAPAAAVEAATTTEIATPAPVAEPMIMEGTVLDGQVIDSSQDMTYTAAPAMAAPVADCGCGAPAPVVAAPVADCGCAAEPAPAPCCEPEPCCCEAPEPEPCCEPAPCCKRERKKVVRTWLASRRDRRNCCCD